MALRARWPVPEGDLQMLSRNLPASTWRVACLALCLAFCLAPGVALARHHNHHRDSAAAPSVAGQYDYFLLSLSWSPSYCLTHQQDRAQCSKGYGFVLHGLWPQNADGGYPENCAADATLPAAALARGSTLFPSPRLMQHEWQRHGSCTGLDALSYFNTADRALAAVKIPAMFEAPRANLSMNVAGIVAAFRAANPELREDGLAVACNRAELSEVRVCLSKGLVPTACGRGVHHACPDVALRIPAAR
jgi:ribonuclease T2